MWYIPLNTARFAYKIYFIRGVFLATGSISDPNKAYHFEITATTMEKAKQIQDIIRVFNIDAKIVLRKKNYVCEFIFFNEILDNRLSIIRKISRNSYYHFRNIAELLNTHTSPHSMRQTYAKELYKETKSLKAVQKALNHNSTNTTKIYLQKNKRLKRKE